MKFELRDTHERHHKKVKVAFDLSDLGREPDFGSGAYFQNKYVLRCVVETSFLANSAQLHGKTDAAKKLVYAHLFRDILPLVQELIMDADDENTVRLASKIKDILMNGGNQ